MPFAKYKKYSFLLNFGYAESTQLGFVPFSSKKMYASTRMALVDLATFFKEAMMQKHELPYQKPCCARSIELDTSAKYCNRCAASLKAISFDVEEYIDFVSQIGGSDINSYAELVDYDSAERWCFEMPKDLSDAKIIYVAEKVLAAALGDEYSPDDRVTLDPIFKDHKGNSYSFWSLR